MSVSTTTGPSWTEIVTALSSAALFYVTAGLTVVTAVLAASAIWAGNVAIRQLDLFQTSERHKKATERHNRTVKLIKEYMTPMFVVEPGPGGGQPISRSPMQAYALLDILGSQLPAASASDDTSAFKRIVANIMMNYIILRNHLDEISDFYGRRLIDEEFYLSRQSTVIIESVAMLRRFAQFSQTSSDDSGFLAHLDKIAHDYVASVRTYSESSGE